MRKYAIILVLLLALTLCACIETPPPATTAPPLPTETTQPTETAPALFCPDSDVIEDFSEYYVLLEHSSDERSLLLSAMGCVFSRPEEIDLNYLFYNGFGNGSWDLVSPESEQYLIDQGFWREMDIQPMPREKLEAILQATFGISLSDVTIPDEWVYLEKEDLYCSNHNDAYGIGSFTITAVRDTGSTIEIAYTTDTYYYNTATDVFLDSAELVLTLKRRENGTIQAISNVIVIDLRYAAMSDRELIDEFSVEEALETWSFSSTIFPLSEEGMAYLADRSPAFAEFISRDTALDTLRVYGPERIEQMKADPKLASYSIHLEVLWDYLCSGDGQS